MTIERTKLGDVEFDDDRVVTFSEGILGFSGSRRFALLSMRKDSPFTWLLSVDRPELAFVVADPFPFFPGYQAQFEDGDLKDLSFREGDGLAMMVIVTVRGKRRKDTTFNLRAPIVVNMRTLTGKQVVLKEEKWEVRASLPVIAPSPSCERVPRSEALK